MRLLVPTYRAPILSLPQLYWLLGLGMCRVSFFFYLFFLFSIIERKLDAFAY